VAVVRLAGRSRRAVPTPPALGIIEVSKLPVVIWPSSGTNFVLRMTTHLTSGNRVTITNGIPFLGLLNLTLAALSGIVS
jgi:hypothetical protein